MTRAWVMPVIIASLAAAIVAFTGATMTEIGPWYHGLVQPKWAPPDAAYGVAWTLIYAFTALAGVYGWLATPTSRGREWLVGLFALNGFLNIVWSMLFFHWHRPDLAMAESILLWMSVASLIAAVRPYSRAATALLLPYLAWVTFAMSLNWMVIQLNGSFS